MTSIRLDICLVDIHTFLYGYPFYESFIGKLLLSIKFVISFKVSFNQDFLTYAGNLVTSENFLGYGMKCDIYEPDSTKLGNALFNSFETALNILCKTFPILFSESYNPLHSLCACLVWSRIFSLVYLALTFGCTWFPSQMYSRAFLLIYPSSESLSIDYFSSVLR